MTSEATLALIKPGAVAAGHAATILRRAAEAGLTISQIAQLRLTAALAGRFYAEHAGRPYYERIVADLASGPIVGAKLTGPDAIATWRRLLGPSDPAVAPPGTIRRDFGTVLPANAAHGSDSPEAFAREIMILDDGAAASLDAVATTALCKTLGLPKPPELRTLEIARRRTEWAALPDDREREPETF